ncbi:MAG: YggS family pyridoxal phosphate-dependent enzyme [Gemmatimonadota bacterium]|nr:YggS family pyridoxal phosphate-dependent enzyme [Gemmatimonadota bacterium]MDE3173640.1 YggS family pyridoxal phosphate-dependent enzyme [Gemmatimonadota bacterium]MDE3215987.1 YggS family pyridoxal phosphate-dependent enzyme [Gemmatimonadota bacterium]
MPFSDLPQRVAEVRGRIAAAVARGGHGQRVTLIAVTKTHGPDAVEAAVAAGVPDVGENRVQEALQKMDRVAVPARWHLIGHLQRNKVRALPRFVLTHSMDRAELAGAIDAYGRAQGRAFDVLVQVNVAGEESKGGYPPATWETEAEQMRGMAGLRVRGVMTMAPLDADEATLRAVFAGARRARDVLCAAGHEATELSMGMSNDFEIAVEEGATCVRLGTVLFGARAHA